MGRLDLPIPYGWYCVGYGDELAPGEVRRVRYFARDLVLFRSEAGEPGLADARCPHRGGHLGHGRVEGGVLRCPLHGWGFAADGRCADIPYVESRAAELRGSVRLGTLPLAEQDGILWAWHHPDGGEPRFPLHAFEEIASGEWADYQKWEWEIATNVQESGENAVDVAHFMTVHKVGEVLAAPEVSFERHRRTSDLALEITRISEQGGMKKGDYVDGHIRTCGSGPGQTWTRQLGIADILILGLPTPIERDRMQLRFAISVPKAQAEAQKPLSRMIVQNAVNQVEQDIPIWEHKIYRPQPILCDGDGPIGEYRRWFQQFYSPPPPKGPPKAESEMA